MILLFNSAVMPNEGVYTLQRISEATFKKELQKAAATGNLKSYIGYPETAEMLEQMTGIQIEASREHAMLIPGDEMLIIKLRYRTADPASNKPLQLSIDDFEFFRCDWQPIDEGGA